MASVHEVKLCLLGDSGVGKSSIVHRFVYDSFKVSMESTIGAAFLTKMMVVDDKTYKFQVWDTAGQEKYRALAPMYYRGASAAIVVYDITDQRTFASMKSWVKELRKHASTDIALAIAGNKNDLEAMREVSFKDVNEYAESTGAFCIETSAKTAENVPALFLEIGKRLSKRPPRRPPPPAVTLHKKNQQQNQSQQKKCC